MSNSTEHWNDAYAQGDTTRGWYQPVAEVSLALIERSGVPRSAAIVDIGAGASVLVDGLLDAGYADITLVDSSPVGLAIARRRLGERAREVAWIDADILTWEPPRRYALWHDRAVSHFLLGDEERARYRATLHRATEPGSIVVLGAFGPQGPTMCAGLPVRRSDPGAVADLLGAGFTVLDLEVIDHLRPDGDTQQYLWALARRD